LLVREVYHDHENVDHDHDLMTFSYSKSGHTQS
jgi:hypothetical protein